MNQCLIISSLFKSITASKSNNMIIFSEIAERFVLCLGSGFSICLCLGEVQQYSHAEMALLQEQLLSAFREQMEIRRSLVELENCNIELHIDTSRHLLTISE